MSLPYKLTSISELNVQGWDGILVVGNKTSLDSFPDPIKTTIKEASLIDDSVHSNVNVYSISYPAKRLIYSPTGALNEDFHDVRSFSEAARKGIERALQAGAKSLILALVPHKEYPDSAMATVLGALEGLYVPIQLRENKPEKKIKMTKVGLWASYMTNMENMIKVVTALECGRIVARDIGGGDPERMAPPRVEEYVIQAMPPTSGVKIEVIKDDKVLEKEYPLFAAVNRAASVIDRHRGRIIFMTYEGSSPKKTLLLLGKGVTYDTGGADLKVGGVMAGMSRDKCGSAAVAGFMKTVSIMAPKDLKVIGVMGMVRNSIGENCYVSDEIIKSRSGKLVRIGNTDAEGRMIMADILCQMKDMAQECTNPHLMTFATLTGHAYLTVGSGYSILMDNGPARKSEFSWKMKKSGERIGDMMEISTIRREDFKFNEGKNEGEDLLQANTQPSSRTMRGHQIPAAFLISVSGLDEHGIGSNSPLPYTHIDIAGSSGDVPHTPSGSPLLAMSSHFLNLSI